MGKKIIISEAQYKRVFLNEQWPMGGTNSQSNTITPNVSEETAKFYRLWANSTTELSKKYGKGSEFDLDAIKTPSNSGTFNKSYIQGKTQFDKDWLIVPNRYSIQDGDPKYGGRLVTDGGKSLYFTKGGEIIYKVNTRTVLPEKLSPKVLIYRMVNGDEQIVDLNEDSWYDGREIYKEVNNIYSSQKTKFATSVIEQEKNVTKDKIGEEIKNVKSYIKERGVPSNLIGGSLSGNHVYAQTSLNIIRQLNTLISEKVITGTKGKYGVCIKGIGTCNIAAGGGYYVANNFSELADNISNKMIDTNKSPYVVVNNTINFDFGKVQKNLDDTFSRDKNATSSNLFPDGWWNFYVKYFGTDNYQKIKTSIQSIENWDIKKNKETLNVYDEKQSIWADIGDCLGDYHCVIDIASMASLALGPYGLMISASFDLLNAGFYGVEYVTANSFEEKRAAAAGATFSLLGVFIGGGGSQAYKYTKGTVPNPKIYNYVDEYVTTVNKKYPNSKNLTDVKKIAVEKDLKNIEKKITKKYNLSKSEIKTGNGIINDLSKVDSTYITNYTNALNTIKSRIKEVNLRMVADTKGMKEMVKKYDGDVVTALNKYMKKKSGKEALQELGLYFILMDVFEEPTVIKWVNERMAEIETVFTDNVRSIIEADGYDWVATKEYFGALQKDDPEFTMEKSEDDNTLLKKAYIAGWRPWPYGEEATEENIEIGYQWLKDNPKYQTDKYKKKMKAGPSSVKVDISDEGIKKSGVEMEKVYDLGSNLSVDEKVRMRKEFLSRLNPE